MVRLRRSLFLRALVTLALCHAAAAAQAEPVTFGSRSLEVPAPAGLRPVSKSLPQHFSSFEQSPAAGMRLVELYFTPADEAALLTGPSAHLPIYYLLNVEKTAEGRPLDTDTLAEIAAQLEAEYARMLPMDSRGRDPGRISASQDAASTPAPEGVTGAPRFAGTFRREPWGRFATLYYPSTVEGDPGRYSASAVVLVNYQLLFLSAHSLDDRREARREAEAGVSAWANAVRAANPDSPLVAMQTGDYRLEANFVVRVGDRDYTAYLPLAVGLSGILVAVFIWWRRRRA